MLINEILIEMPAITTRHVGSKPLVKPGGLLGDKIWSVVEPGKYMSELVAYPDPGQVPSGQFPTETQLNSIINQVQGRVGKIHWVNEKERAGSPGSFLAFVISKWVNEDKNIFYIGKFLHNSKNVLKAHANAAGNYGNPTKFDANDLASELGYYSSHGNNRHAVAPGISKDNDNVAQLSRLEPKDLLTVDREYTINEIISELSKKLGKNSNLVKLTQDVAGGNQPVSVDITGININMLDKYFTEILHPIALITGAYQGDRPQYNFDNSRIEFTGPSGALSDSIIRLNDGVEVFVSSKKNSGTAPAIGKDFNELLLTVPNKIKKQLAFEYSILNTIANAPQEARPGKIGPLAAAVQLNILTENEANYIADVLSRTPQAQYEKLPKDCPPRLKEILKKSPSQARGKMSYYYLMRYAMSNVAQIMNENPNTSKLIKYALGTDFVTMSTIPTLSGNIDTLVFRSKLLDDARKIVLTIGTAYHYDHIKNRLQFIIQ